MRVYIASPYTHGNTELNVQRSIDAAEAVAQRGHTVIAPLLSHFWHLRHPHPWKFWMAQCLDLLTCADMLLRLDGESVGADIEVREAKAIGIPVVYRIEDIPDNGNEDGA